ncbi:hypothetical protein OH76DRAFT_195980 [Lentinus brumalis]|uniref:F-box domain-containing protein n=1 Tax=Lentinus brumalis TaxID=2498619 RepID=A0A371DI40_9APHY|nr:hypothetical protein OH76DRAFT_195980 [Polyporus brumalis]
MSVSLFNVSAHQKPRVSADVLLLIIDAVSSQPSSHGTLCACALTCRTARQRSQVHLFQVIKLTSPIQCQLLGRTIHARQDLGQLVEHISLYCAKGWKRARVRFEDHPLPPHVVAALTNLRSVKFVGGTVMPGVDEYDPPALLSFIKLFGSLATLKELTVRNIMFPEADDIYRLSWSFPSIERLFLRRCWTACAYRYDSFDSVPVRLFYPGYCQSLNSLEWFTECPPEFLLQPLWGTSVKHLNFRSWYERHAAPENYAGKLELWLNHHALKIDWFERTLQHVSSRNMQTLVIHHETYPEYTYENVHTKLDQIALGEGASEVLKTWPRLKRVRWVVHCYHEDLEVATCQCRTLATEIETSVPAPWLRSMFSVKLIEGPST